LDKEDVDLENGEAVNAATAEAEAQKKKPRLRSLDTFRGYE
jgi:hypothetical protein